MAVIAVPNGASTYSTDACIVNSAFKWANLGFTAAGGSGSCFYFTGSSLATASPLLPIVCASGGQTYQSVTFMATCTIIAACISSGCAVAWLKSSS